MEALHAPWRIEYILGPKRAEGKGSIFTTIAQSTDDQANHVIARGKSCFAVMNNFPYNAGHLMIVPYREVPDLADLNNEELLELMQLCRRCQAALRETMDPGGFNIGLNLGQAAGAGIQEHLHLHVLPRWNGDTNFMPALGQTTVIPEAITETAAKLRAALAQN
ncbi:MAG: HIT domain-containing protein [Verrucomicrobia subdivision 3 bacterium]|nr:HIT domain-containing protein [Limisphaerales bacterium]